MQYTEPLTEQEERDYRTSAEAYFATDPDVAEVYRHGNLTVEGACLIYVQRARAGRLGIPVPAVVAEPVPVGYARKANPRDPDYWSTFVADQRKGHGQAGQELWERLRQRLSIIEHEPITRAEREARDHPVATQAANEPHPRLEAARDWLDEQQGLTPPASRATATYILTDDMEPYTGPVPREQDQPYLTR